jgi:hypothetical protein
MLEKWGASPEKARELVDRLIATTTAAHKRADLDSYSTMSVVGECIAARGRSNGCNAQPIEFRLIGTIGRYAPDANPQTSMPAGY